MEVNLTQVERHLRVGKLQGHVLDADGPAPRAAWSVGRVGREAPFILVREHGIPPLNRGGVRNRRPVTACAANRRSTLMLEVGAPA
jgi:hypothetical protein